MHLIDTDGRGVDRIDSAGAWVAGDHYPVDCLIYASGFEFGTELSRRTGFETVHGFPNLFDTSINQGAALLSNITHKVSESAKTMSQIIIHALWTKSATVEVELSAERDWVAIFEPEGASLMGGADCTPGYYNNEGQAVGRRERLNIGRYPGGPVEFFKLIKARRESDLFEGLRFDR